MPTFMDTAPAAAGYALAIWWLSTGIVLWLAHRPAATRPWTLVGAGAAAACASWVAAATADDLSAGGSYLAFTAAIVVWAFLEMTFLFGVVTGPSRLPCASGATGWARLRSAAAVVLYHEFALAAGAVGLCVICWREANTLAAATFGALWIMRLSAKLSLFLGVRNHAADLLLPDLAYLATYFRRRNVNAFWVVAVLALSSWAVWLTLAAARAEAADATALALLATLVWLGALEHLFLVLPVRLDALLGWRGSSAGAAAGAPAQVERSALP
jgi:putative photosynthetic complex assembly protein 2